MGKSLSYATPLDNSPGTPSGMRRDLISAYTVAASRIAARALVSALVYRHAGSGQFAMLALIWGTIGILNYTAVGLLPAMIRMFAWAKGRDEQSRLFSAGIFIAAGSTVIGLALTLIYATRFTRWHTVPLGVGTWDVMWGVILIGVGILFRLFSDSLGAVLQARHRIALDNWLLAGGDFLWALSVLVMYRDADLILAALTFAAASGFILVARAVAVSRVSPHLLPLQSLNQSMPMIGPLLSLGSLVLIAQLAEYFYAPTDYILIDHFFGPASVADYAPGVQIDLALLTLVGGLAAVLLPKSALAHAAGNAKLLRHYYLRGTFASTLILVAASISIWLFYPMIFRLWFGPHPPDTRQILDLILIGTIIGGSSAVGRSILIGMGKLKAFTAAALLAGAVNAFASFGFAKYSHAGLRGILYGTLIAVVGRCGIWMPWYVLRALRKEESCA